MISPFSCFLVNLRHIFFLKNPLTLWPLLSIDYGNCLLFGNNMHKMWKMDMFQKRKGIWECICEDGAICMCVCVGGAGSLWRLSNPLEGGPYNKQQSLYWGSQCSLLPLLHLSFHMEIKASGWGFSSFPHVAVINSTSNRTEEGKVLAVSIKWRRWLTATENSKLRPH